MNIFYKPSKFLEKLLSIDNNCLYYPINGGSSLQNSYSPSWLHFDDTGDNISEHNHALNEMTSIYWFWKNYPWKNLDYVGFNHYRRVFKPANISDFMNYDVIVAKHYKFNIDLEQQYFLSHNLNDMKIFVGVLSFIKQKTGVDFQNYLHQNYMFAPCNMFLMKSKLFNQYCEFMFPCLFKAMKYVHLEDDKYQHRAIAFLSERLTSFWFSNLKQEKKIKEVPIMFLEDN